jgi:excinuclease ABC subunit A
MARPSPTTHILVTGAREHNLQGFDLALPRDSLDVITGLSGSGKSSLAFDTIFQEGQRRYLESLSAYARQFLGKLEKPKVERVEGLSPTLAIDQKSVSKNPRSTVGTVTEILDHLRLWMARLGTPHCPVCGRVITPSSPGAIVDRLLADHGGRLCLVMAPVVRERKGEYRKDLQKYLQEGYTRVRIDGEMHLLDEPTALARYEKHTIEIVVDRIVLSAAQRSRLLEAVGTALGLADGVLSVLVTDLGAPSATIVDEAGQVTGAGDGAAPGDRLLTFATGRGCPDHDVYLPEMEPRLFSFNAPQGACPTCQGLGALEGFDTAALFDRDLPAWRACRAMAQGHLPFSGVDEALLARVLKRLGTDPNAPWAALPPEVAEKVLRGDPSITYTRTRDEGGRRIEIESPWEGVLPVLDEVWYYTHHAALEPFRRRGACPDCGGARLNAVARAVTWRGHTLPELTRLAVGDAFALFSGTELEGTEALLGAEILKELLHRLRFLDNVGLGYLTIDRPTMSLSGGESQRIRLAAQVGSGLQGVTYVLDEPSIGLHSTDNRRLLSTLVELRNQGNTVLVVEHDAETMLRADWLVEVGPGAGREGGCVVAAGSPGQFLKRPSLTADFLLGRAEIPVPKQRRPGDGHCLLVRGAHANNLRSIDVAIPLGTFTVLTGVSGSGKSTLLFDVLEPVVSDALQHRPTRNAGCDRVEGLELIDKIIRIDQDPIGRTPRSNPATYTGAMDGIRDLFASVPEAKARGYRKGRFSFNVPGGRCEACEGAGLQTLEMQFLADVEVPCEVCGGKRFNGETLEIRYRGRTISDVLEMPISEAAAFFGSHRALHRVLATLDRVGLGYVALGQPSTTLSGGEAQRIKLSSELHRPPTGHTLYLLDEPTTGLHFADIARLLDALGELVDAGNTVVVIEHNTDVIKVADWLVDLGPGGGQEGGRIVAQGSPELVAGTDTATGHVLAEVLGRRSITSLSLAGESEPQALERPHHGRDVVIRGARRHNLKGIDVTFPHGKLSVVTGVSGSGKTSLALHTLFSEGQRRYIESLSTYARRFLGRLDRAPVDSIDGLAPSIAIEQRASARNPRSTVATVTEVYDLMRLLWTRIGQPHCPECNRPLGGLDPSAAARRLQDLAPGRGRLLADLKPANDPSVRRNELSKDGFVRLFDPVASADVDLDQTRALELLAQGAVLVVDRVDPVTVPAERLAAAVALAYGYGDDRARFLPLHGEPVILTLQALCPEHGRVLPEVLTPRCFSFNSQAGACPDCDGLGEMRTLDLERLFPRPSQGVFEALDARVSAVLRMNPKHPAEMASVLGRFDLALHTPVSQWSAAARRAVLEGLDGTIDVAYERNWGRTKVRFQERVPWKGLYAIMDEWETRLDWLHRGSRCTTCGGGRLKRAFLAVRVGGLGIAGFAALTVKDALSFLGGVQLSVREKRIVDQLLPELASRLRFLDDVGLGYLTLDRTAHTLSGGESQRIRLASQLGSRLTDTIYVLDEPTIGLHASDTDRLLRTLEGLRDLGNTVVVVEHDPATIRRADFVVDLGPGAGELGGQVVAAGPPESLISNPQSLTGAYLSGRKRIEVPASRRPGGPPIVVRGARRNNLKSIDVAFPTGGLTVVTGVSGSGKSSLVMDTLHPALEKALGLVPDADPLCDGIDLPPSVERVVVVDASPIGRTPRSCPATYTKVMDGLRKLFARTNAAQTRGLGPDAFSFNASGRCPVCEGRGALQIEMHFLSDVWVPCEECGGRRFNERVLEVTWQGRSIADVLNSTVDEALSLFAVHRAIARPLRALAEVGLGYLRLGQSATALSGGEAQRVKLAGELLSTARGSVYLLDEPTTGLHLADVERLLGVLQGLVDRGHTVVVIEHHLDVIRAADHVIDLGPEGGDAGGFVVVAGTPEQVAACPESRTGAVLGLSGVSASPNATASSATSRPRAIARAGRRGKR